MKWSQILSSANRKMSSFSKLQIVKQKHLGLWNVLTYKNCIPSGIVMPMFYEWNATIGRKILLIFTQRRPWLQNFGSNPHPDHEAKNIPDRTRKDFNHRTSGRNTCFEKKKLSFNQCVMDNCMRTTVRLNPQCHRFNRLRGVPHWSLFHPQERYKNGTLRSGAK